MLLSLDIMLSCNDILLSTDRVQCAWLPGAAVWKRLPSCDEVTRTYKMFTEQYRKANDRCWVLLNCLGEKMFWHICRMVAWIFFVWLQHCCYALLLKTPLTTLLLAESLYAWAQPEEGLTLIGFVPKALQSVLCWEGRLLWGSCLTTLPLSEALLHLTDSLISNSNRRWSYKVL